ncbi:MAG: tetratricopeptide repeat-containing sensor histidine kinase [Candidatus Cloacimonetes bacterium]|nr:tetratricopeptide repeat-containing sensor histidine kinase [Candidatus Cloacimonadota bacterium]
MEKKEYLEKIANSEGEEKYQAILKYAWFLRQKEPLESAEQAKKVIKYARMHENTYLELKALAYLCYAYFYTSDMVETSRWVDKLEKISKKYDNNCARGTAYGMKSRIALNQCNTAEAMENALIALDYNLKDNNPKALTTSYFALGMIHLQREENTEAEHYLQLALQNAEETNNHAQYSIRVNIGNILFNEQKYDDALNEYLICLEYFKEQDMVSSMASVLLNIGLCHRFLKNYETGLEYMMQSYKLFENMKNPQKLGLAANAIANIYIMQSDWDNALKYLQKAERLAETHNFKSDLVSCYSNYVKYHENKEEYVEANNYLHKIQTLKDKINIENHQEKMSILETKYKTQIYRMKSAELNEKNKAVSNQNKQLHETLGNLQETYKKLQIEFQEVVNKLNSQDDLLSTQSRMAMMGELISAIAHQWKQPLNVIWVMAQAIGEAWEYEELDDEFMESQLKLIEEQVMYMSETVNDFRNYFNQDYTINFNVAKTIEKTIHLVSYITNKNGINLVSELDNKCSLTGNPNELSQVLINVFNNARDAIVDNEINDPYIKVVLSCDPEFITIKVFNKGKHIEPENLDKIFESYYTTKGKEGSGIGLSICRKIVKNKFGGHIIARNLDEGVEFEIKMPIL